MNLPVAILAGGLATRLRPLTGQMPKSLIQVAGQPFIVQQLNLLRRNGFTNVVLCLGHLGEQIQKEVGDGQPLGLHVRDVFEVVDSCSPDVDMAEFHWYVCASVFSSGP